MNVRTLPILMTVAAALLAGNAYGQSFRILHFFPAGDAGGFNPSSPLIEAQTGVFYGVTNNPGCGTFYSLTRDGVYTKLHDFRSQQEGCSPELRLVQGPDGLLYGCTQNYTNGISSIYRTDLSGNFTVLQQFSGSLRPYPHALDVAPNGDVYGIVTTQAQLNSLGGFFFRYTPAGVFTILYTFPQAGSFGPDTSLLRAGDGYFYGFANGVSQNVLYRISKDGTFEVLQTFDSTNSQFYRLEGLTEDHDGRLYGIDSGSALGADGTPEWAGGIFTIDRDGSGFEYLYRWPMIAFQSEREPSSNLIELNDGNLYGAVVDYFDSNNAGLYRVTAAGVYTDLMSFVPNDGLRTPHAAVPFVQASDGLLYGTLSQANIASSGGSAFVYDLGLAPPVPQPVEFAPAAATAGQLVIIHGRQLLQSTSVEFNGVPARFAIKGHNFIAAIVPAGATSGPITITSPNGAGSTRYAFTVQ